MIHIYIYLYTYDLDTASREELTNLAHNTQQKESERATERERAGERDLYRNCQP